MSSERSSQGLPGAERQTGDTTFNIVCLLGSLFLFSQMWSQTVWTDGQKFAAQPGFWPRLSVFGMVLFSSWNLHGSHRDQKAEERLVALGEEVRLWLSSLEYALWFMAYVFATPVIGYLAATIVFAVALTLRAGYRTWPMLAWAAIAAVAIVILFKSFLQVKIPGGAIYEVLPDGLRSFFILYM